MVWRLITSFFLQRQSGQVTEQLVQKLSEFYPIRRAAQITAYFFLRGKDKFNNLPISDYKKKLQEEIKKVQDNMRK